MTAEAVAGINALPEKELRVALRQCCASTRWVDRVVAARPYASAEALLEVCDRALEELIDDDWLEAFAAVGIREPYTTDNETRNATLVALQLYEEQFGYPFVIAEQLGDEELLMRVRIRLGLDPSAQFRASRTEQRRLVHARLQRLIERTGGGRDVEPPTP